MQKRRILYGLGVLIVLFGLLAFTYQFKLFKGIDQKVLTAVMNGTNSLLTVIFFGITMLIDEKALVALFLLFIVVIKKKEDVLYVFGVTGVGYLVGAVVKSYIKRPRPEVMQLIEETGYSFPSNHTLVATIFYGLIAYFIIMQIKDKNLKIIVGVLMTLLVLAIGFSRIYLRVHYFTDVVGGLLLGGIILIVGVLAHEYYLLLWDRLFPKKDR